MLSFGLLWNAVLLVGGGIWCKEVVARLPRDLREFRQHQDAAPRLAMGAIWVLTVGIAWWIVQFVGSCCERLF